MTKLYFRVRTQRARDALFPLAVGSDLSQFRVGTRGIHAVLSQLISKVDGIGLIRDRVGGSQQRRFNRRDYICRFKPLLKY